MTGLVMNQLVMVVWGSECVTWNLESWM